MFIKMSYEGITLYQIEIPMRGYTNHIVYYEKEPKAFIFIMISTIGMILYFIYALRVYIKCKKKYKESSSKRNLFHTTMFILISAPLLVFVGMILFSIVQ